MAIDKRPHNRAVQVLPDMQSCRAAKLTESFAK